MRTRSLWLLFLVASATDDGEDFLDALDSLIDLTENFDDRRARATEWPRRSAELLDKLDVTKVDDSVEVGAFLLSEWAEGANADSLNATLETLADGARRRLPPGGVAMEHSCSADWNLRLMTGAKAAVNAVSEELFEGLGLKGDTENYYDPANSFMSSVFRRKLGIPISLSIIWVAVARRVGLASFVLSHFPGHVLVRVPVGCLDNPAHDSTQDLYVDTFDAAVMSYGELQSFASRRGVSSNPEVLQSYVTPGSFAEVHARVLRNLWRTYGKREDYTKLVGVIDMAVAFGVPEAEQLKRQREVVLKRLRETPRSTHTLEADV